MAPADRPTRKLLDDAHQFLLTPQQAERMTAAVLSAEIESRKKRMVGRRNYGWLMHRGIDPKKHGLNWHDARYLYRLEQAQGKLPDNWLSLVMTNRTKERGADNGGK